MKFIVPYWLKSVAHETKFLDHLGLGLFIATLVLCFFPIFSILNPGYNTLLNYYSDFAAIKFFGALVPALGFIVITIFSEKPNKILTKPILVGLLVAAVVTFYYYLSLPESINIVSLYNSVLISCALLFGYCVYKSEMLRKNHIFIMWIFVILGVISSFIGIVQFIFDSSVGLKFLGESQLSSTAYGVAKVLKSGAPHLRSYSLFPHPNIFGFMMLIPICYNFYLLTKSSQLYTKLILSLSGLCLIIALFLTLSRSALLAGSLVGGYILAISLLKKSFSQVLAKSWPMLLGIIVSAAITYPWLVNRTSVDDSSIVERGEYFHVAEKLAINNWFLGTAPGTNLFHMEQWLVDKLDPWNVQPVHNIPLLIFSELGILGLFIVFLALSFLYRILRNSLSNLDASEDIVSMGHIYAGLAIGVFALFWFDHYLWTYLPAQLMLVAYFGMALRPMKE